MDSRKENILKAIIREYIFGAEPVSSKTILNRYGLNVSSATIRNEMAALEDLGYIIQPHVSSGRVPAPTGYRYYVDNLMESDQSFEEFQLVNMESSSLDNIHHYIKEVASLLAGLSNYTVIVTEEKRGEHTIKHLKLVGLMENKGLLILVLSGSKVKDYVLSFLEKISDTELHKLSVILDEHLQNRSIEELDEAFKGKLRELFPDSPLLVEEILTIAEKALRDEKDVNVIIEGVKNIFKLPEFNEVKKIENFINTMENQDTIVALLDNVLSQGKGKVQVRIGEELGLEELKDFTVIATNCSFCDGFQGKIGIIGPTRMFYEKNIRLLEAILRNEEEENGRKRSKETEN